MIQIPGCHFRKHPAEFCPQWVRKDRVRIGIFIQLLTDGCLHSRMIVGQINGEGATTRIEISIPGGIIEIHAFRPGDFHVHRVVGKNMTVIPFNCLVIRQILSSYSHVAPVLVIGYLLCVVRAIKHRLSCKPTQFPG